MNLIESYKNRLAVSESVYQKSHNGAKMNNSKKLMIATVLNNTSRFMNEAFTDSAATQRSALGDYKRFCLNISTVALPNLILPDLMLTQPMTSLTGYVTYLKFTAGVAKGGVKQGETFNSVYRLGEMTKGRVDYTSDKIVEPVTAGEEFTPAWTPVEGSIRFLVGGVWVDGEAGTVPEGATKVAYVYDNVVIPQKGNGTDAIPTLTAKMDYITLHAHARRIAVYYSQIAAFQSKTDYGTDLATELTTQAQGELAYEIDTEGVNMLVEGAEVEDALNFDCYEIANQNTYISRSQYYEQFAEIFARAKKVLYTRTRKFAPNYMICGANILTVLPYLKGWTAASVSEVNGPYFAGTVDGIKVFVSPAIDENEYVFGVNGSDLKASAAVYAPYMAIVPTQLLGFADGTMSQGFSTMYDMKLLATYDKNGDDIVESDEGETGRYSWLLAKGHMNV